MQDTEAKAPCLYPFLSFTVNRGTVRPCCATVTSIGRMSDIEDTQIFFETNPQLQALREGELAGKWTLPTCHDCQQGNVSKQTFNLWMKQRFPDYNPATDPPEVRHLSIDLSNICNLTCAMCSSENSSSWDKHELQMGSFNPQYYRAKNGNWQLSKIEIDRIIQLLKPLKLSR